MRPPYGDIDDRVRYISLQMGLTVRSSSLSLLGCMLIDIHDSLSSGPHTKPTLSTLEIGKLPLVSSTRRAST